MSKKSHRLNQTLPTILADPEQLGQVFGNVILNAIQAMAEGGQLTIKTSASLQHERSVEASERGTLTIKTKVDRPQWVAVSFTDTGPGIPGEKLQKVFEPLFTTKAKGIGLGLALTKTMVEGHGGTVEVKSTEGKGSTFTVRLPSGLTIED